MTSRKGNPGKRRKGRRKPGGRNLPAPPRGRLPRERRREPGERGLSVPPQGGQARERHKGRSEPDVRSRQSAAAAKAFAFARLGRFDRSTGWLLLLWPTLWALEEASGSSYDWRVFVVIAGGVILTRAAGCVANDIADRKVDGLVARTKNRPLPAGELTVAEAAAFGLALLAACFGLWLALSPPARAWALAALAVGATYPLAKRFVQFPQAHLGIAFGMGIPVAAAEVTGSVPASMWILFAANFFWVLAYDTTYALADREDDVRAGIKSLAVWLGERAVLAVALFYFGFLALLVIYGVAIGSGIVFYLACALAFGNAVGCVRKAATLNPESCIRAFNDNAFLGALIMLGLAADR